jgi:hypothetical protein
MSEHTEGPWLMGVNELTKQSVCQTTAHGGRLIAYAHSQHYHSYLCEGITQSTMTANARLIAAAPDLLVACHKLLKVLELEPECKIYKAHMALAKNAILKAEGGS